MGARTVVLAVNPDVMPEVARLLAGVATISEPLAGAQRMRVHKVHTPALPVCLPEAKPNPSAVELTPRLRETLQMLADGLSVKEMARRMGVAPASAKTHTARLYRLLGVNGAPEAVAVGYRTGMLTGGES